MIHTGADAWQKNGKPIAVSKAKSSGVGHLPLSNLGLGKKLTRLKAAK